MMPPDPL